MKTSSLLVLISAGFLTWSAHGAENFDLSKRWRARIDLGGTFPEAAALTELGGPVTSGNQMKLSPGMQVDVAVGYRLTPWLTLEGELGFTYNEVTSVGNWSYPNSALYQMLMMANMVVEYPRGPCVPFAGVGAGGVYSTLSFGNYYYYGGYSDPDGSGTDFVPAFQAFGGVRYQFNEQWSLGVIYRFLLTENQKWDVGWWDGRDFGIGVNAVAIQSICLVVSFNF